MRLLNTKNRVPGGWRYEQFDANGKLLHKFQSFDPWAMFLNQIAEFRKANHLVRQNLDFVEADVTEYLSREFGGDPRYFTSDPGQKKTSLTSRLLNPGKHLASFADKTRKVFIGEEVLREWLGTGLRPVTRTEAQARADICLGRNGGVPCPHNQRGSVLIEEAARWVQAIAEKKNDLALSVSGEKELQSCRVCLCDLKLKVHVPMKTILSQTPEAMLEKFASEAPVNCWMRNQTTTPA